MPQLATLPGVYRVEAYDPPMETNDKVVQTAHTWDVWKGGRNGLLQDLMGAGQIAGSVDSGLDNKSTSPTIEDFFDYTGGTTTSRVVYNQNSAGCGGSCSATDTNGHGTHTSGSIVGNGYNSLAQRGLTSQATGSDPFFDYAWGVGQAPEAKIAMVHAGDGSGGIYTTPATDWVTLYNQGARNVNNSWGNSTYSYGANSITADNVMWTYQDSPHRGLGRQHRARAPTVAQPANAKNIISVGGSLNHRSVWAVPQTADTANLLADSSAPGRSPRAATPGSSRTSLPRAPTCCPPAPTRSPRTTTVGWGNDGGMDGGDGDGDNDNRLDYAWNGGTSMSAPQVTGAATIVRDYFQDIQGLGNTTPPSAALIKAALVNGAVDMGYGYEIEHGLVPTAAATCRDGAMPTSSRRSPHALRAPSSSTTLPTSLTAAHQSTMGTDSTGDYVQYTVSVVDSSEPLKVTLTWTDYAERNHQRLCREQPEPAGDVAERDDVYYGNNFTGSWSRRHRWSRSTPSTTPRRSISRPGGRHVDHPRRR